MSKKCTPLRHEARFQVKTYKTHHFRSTFGRSDVEKVHAFVARSTFRSQHVKNTRGSDHFWRFRCRFASFRFTTLHYITLHYTTLHYTTLQYITLHCTTLQLQLHNYTPLRSSTLHYTKLHCTTLHYTTLHSATLHYTTLHYHQFLPFVFLLIYSGLSIQVHFGLFTQPCHWLKRLHIVITWGHTCFLVVCLQRTQTICFSG